MMTQAEQTELQYNLSNNDPNSEYNLDAFQTRLAFAILYLLTFKAYLL